MFGLFDEKERKDSETTLVGRLGSQEDVKQIEEGDKRDVVFVRVHGEDDYVPIRNYEGRHRYDPTYTWSVDSEKKLTRKVDLRLFAWVFLTFMLLQLDRNNIQQALADDMLKDLKIKQNDYNHGQTIFFGCFMISGIPNQLIAKWLGPERWYSCQLVLWSLVASLQSLLSGKDSFFATRAVLGLLEGGIVAELVLYLSAWYTSRELSKRLFFLFSSFQVAAIIGAFVATGLFQMRGVNQMEGWRWLFAIEGLVVGLVGLLTFLYLPAGPCQTRPSTSWLRLRPRAGWFSVHEEKILVNKILREDPSKGDMNNRQPINLQLFWHALCDWEMWPLYLLGLSTQFPTIPTTQYLSIILKQLFHDRFQVSMLLIPAYVIFIINLFWITFLAEKTRQRMLTGLVSQIYSIGPLLALLIIPAQRSAWSYYAPLILLVGAPYIHSTLVGLTSRNAGSVRTRAVSIAVLDVGLQASNAIGSQIYRTDDKPLYRRGNAILLAIVVYNAVLFVAARYFYKWRNQVREQKWNSMTRDEREAYLQRHAPEAPSFDGSYTRDSSISTTATATDHGHSKERYTDGDGDGNKLLTFRFAY